MTTEMTNLEKARGAMTEARRIQEANDGKLLIGEKHAEWNDLIAVASVNALIAQAAALNGLPWCSRTASSTTSA